ncbi:hypothetical protein GBA52_020403 [Prunus armeniaca]|nr:hypothetical protein GBA52_020403 [Prunus armeniaca]
MPEATRRPLESRAPQKKKEGPPRQRTKAPCQAEGPSAEEVMVAGRRREKRVAEAEEVREAYLQVSGKRPRGPSEDSLRRDAFVSRVVRTLRPFLAVHHGHGGNGQGFRCFLSQYSGCRFSHG